VMVGPVIRESGDNRGNCRLFTAQVFGRGRAQWAGGDAGIRTLDTALDRITV
jgi:hypothetical protein